MLSLLLPRQASRNSVFFPEVAQREEIRHPVISEYLEGLVRRGLVPRAIAGDINRISDLNRQREAVTLFWAKQRAQAWEERRQRSERYRATFKAAGYAVAGLCTVLFLKEVRFYPPVVSPSARPPHGSRVHRHVEHPRSRAAAAPPRTAKIRSAAPAIHSNVPVNFAVRSGAKGVRFSWDPMGPGYTYTLYSDDEPTMRNLRKEKVRISGTAYTMALREAQEAGTWWAITATNAYGGESPLSGAVNSFLRSAR